jgi:hypothetical protein
MNTMGNETNEEIRNVWDVLRTEKINKRKVKKIVKKRLRQMSEGESILNKLYVG